MGDPDELALVRKALMLGIGGCVDWDVWAADRVEPELARHGLTLEVVAKSVIQHARSGGDVVQVKETRDPWKDRRDYWHKVIVPMPRLFTKGLFVEIELRDSDPELPEAILVNAHEQL